MGPDRLAVLSLILCSVFRSRAQPPFSLPPPCPACLPISHPLRVCVCMYITVIAPSNPHHDVPVLLPPPTLPSMLPILTWHDFLSPPSCLLGLRGTGSLTQLLPLPSLQPSLPSLMSTVYSLCIAIYHPADSPAADPIM